MSPLLANIYLHEVLDTWFAQTVVPRLRAKGFMVMEVLGKRFARYGLTLHPAKTRIGMFFEPEPPREQIDEAFVWLRDWAKERDLDLSPEVNMPLGDGKKPNYDMAVCALLEAR